MYREKRKRIAEEKWRARRTIGVSLMSGGGAGLFLSVALPFQVVGRVPQTVLPPVILMSVIFMTVFGMVMTAGYRSFFAATYEMPTEYWRWYRRAVVFLGVIAFGFLGVVLGTLWVLKEHPELLSAGS
jgi:hypothetical protein